MPIPTLTNLQFFILKSLANGDKLGVDLRKSLADNGVSQSRPAFYVLMRRLADANLIDGQFETSQKANQVVTEKLYSLTKHGSAVLEQSVEFYSKEA